MVYATIATLVAIAHKTKLKNCDSTVHPALKPPGVVNISHTTELTTLNSDIEQLVNISIAATYVAYHPTCTYSMSSKWKLTPWLTYGGYFNHLIGFSSPPLPPTPTAGGPWPAAHRRMHCGSAWSASSSSSLPMAKPITCLAQRW